MANSKLEIVENLLKRENAVEAKKVFSEIMETDCLEYFLIKGKLEQKFQNWSEAINAYSKVLDFDPGNVEAKNNLHVIKNILNFWNPEMFNP